RPPRIVKEQAQVGDEENQEPGQASDADEEIVLSLKPDGRDHRRAIECAVGYSRGDDGIAPKGDIRRQARCLPSADLSPPDRAVLRGATRPHPTQRHVSTQAALTAYHDSEEKHP